MLTYQLLTIASHDRHLTAALFDGKLPVLAFLGLRSTNVYRRTK